MHLQDDETLVIGGLIQENDTRTTTKLPFLGDLPLIGGAFRSDSVQGERNELIIVVTPHIGFSPDVSLVDPRRGAAEEVMRVLPGEPPHHPRNTPAASSTAARNEVTA